MIDEIVKASESKDDFMARIARRMHRKEVPFSSSSSHLGTLWNKPNTQKLKAICLPKPESRISRVTFFISSKLLKMLTWRNRTDQSNIFPLTSILKLKWFGKLHRFYCIFEYFSYRATYMLVTLCWWQFSGVGDRISILVTSFVCWCPTLMLREDVGDKNDKNRHQHLKVVGNTFCLQHPSSTSM